MMRLRKRGQPFNKSFGNEISKRPKRKTSNGLSKTWRIQSKRIEFAHNKFSKKGMTPVIVSMILGLVVIALAIPFIRYIKDTSDTSKFQEWGINPDDGFQPWDYDAYLSPEERTADASMKALQMAINYLSGGKSLMKTENVDSTNVKEYTVTYYITYGYDELYEPDYTKAISTARKDDFTNPSEFWTHVFDNRDDAKKSSTLETLQNIKHVKEVHNIQLDVTYNDGTKCSEDTIEDGKDAYDGNTLSTWGGKDSNGNFRDGPDEGDEPDTSCSDSPSWVQCRGIKVYYCGHKGSKEYEGEKTEINYWENGKSTSKVKTRVEFNDENKEGTSVSRDGTIKLLLSSVARGIEVVSDTVDDIPILGSLNGYSLGKGTYERTKAYCYDGFPIDGTDIVVKCEEGGTICYVCNFYLPQEVSTKDWITGFGDPQFLAYYESFPEGAGKYWEYATLKTGAYIGVSMLVAGTISFVTSKAGVKVSPQALKTAIKEGSEEVLTKFGKEIFEGALKEGTEQALKELTDRAGKEGIKTIVKSGLFRNSLEELSQIGGPRVKYFADIYENFLKEEAKAYSGTFLKTSSTIAKEIEDNAKDRFIKNLDDIISSPEKYGWDSDLFKSVLLDQYGKKIIYNTPEVRKLVLDNLEENVGKSISKNMLKEFMIERSTINTFKNLLSEGGEKFSKETVENVLKQSESLVTSLDKLPKSFQKKILDNTNKRMQKMFTKDGFFKTSVIDGFDDKIDDLAGTIPDSSLRRLGDALKEAYGTLKGGITQAGEWAPSKGWIDGPYFPLAFSINPFKQVSKSTKFLYGKRYTLLFSVVLLAEYQDSVNDKFASGGVNSLLLGAPSVIEEKKREYPLAEVAKKYYLALRERYNYEGQHTFRQNIETTRLYLSSPCKTDLVLKIQDCNCMRRPENNHYNFGGGPIDIRKGTITFDSEPPEAEKKEIMDTILDGNQFNESSRLRDNDLIKNYPNLIQYIDDDNAVKVCEDRGLWESFKSTFGNQETENYKTKCISVEPFILDAQINGSNYCYPRYPLSEEAKSLVSSAVILLDVVAGIATATGVGAIVGVPALVIINMGDIAFSGLVTELWQKWPKSEPEGVSSIELVKSATS